MGADAERLELLLVEVRVGGRAQQDHDVAVVEVVARLDQGLDPAREQRRLGGSPLLARAALCDEQLGELLESGALEAATRDERAVAGAERLAEHAVDHGQHLGAAAEVAAQVENRRRLLAPLHEHGHIGVPEAIDRLELVAHEEALRASRQQQVEDVALQAVRVLELVDEQLVHALVDAGAHGLVAFEQVTRHQLQVLEVDRALLRLERGIGGLEPAQQRGDQRGDLGLDRRARCGLERDPRRLVHAPLVSALRYAQR